MRYLEKCTRTVSPEDTSSIAHGPPSTTLHATIHVFGSRVVRGIVDCISARGCRQPNPFRMVNTILMPHIVLSSLSHFWRAGVAGSRISRVYAGISRERARAVQQRTSSRSSTSCIKPSPLRLDTDCSHSSKKTEGRGAAGSRSQRELSALVQRARSNEDSPSQLHGCINTGP